MKIWIYYKRFGFYKTLRKSILRLMSASFLAKARYANFQRTIRDEGHDVVFSTIYRKNLWGDEDSKSGWGSTAAKTEEIRKHLPSIIERFGVKMLLDAPCGDFYWMRLVNLPEGTCYIGADIVPDLIRLNIERYASRDRTFIVKNLIQDPLPYADLLINRDCLIHFSFADIAAFFDNYVSSGIPYIMTTTFKNPDKTLVNNDIHTGDYRPIDLFVSPFFFPGDVLYRVDEGIREMCIWSRDQIVTAIGAIDGSRGQKQISKS